jgi:hypothetical protein
VEQINKDETRWLGRVFAFFCIVLSIRILTVLLKRIQEEQLSLLMFVSLGASVLFFWLAYRLMTCSSLWDLFSWMPEKLPLFQYLQCRYFLINRNIRCGLIGAVILLILVAPLPLMFSRYQKVGFWEFVKAALYVIFWPLRQLFEIIYVFQSPTEHNRLMIVCIILYLFAVGFIVGFLISYLTGFIDKRNYISPKDLNNGSPGCSEAELGVKEDQQLHQHY